MDISGCCQVMLSCQGITGQCLGDHWAMLSEHQAIPGENQATAEEQRAMPGEQRAIPGEPQETLGEHHKAICQDPALGTSTQHINSHRQQQLHHCPAPSEMFCAQHVPRWTTRWDLEATASPQFHLPPSHLPSNLMSSSNTLSITWQQQYQHRNSCTGMEMVLLAWQHGGKEIKMSGRSSFLHPRVTKLLRLPWIPPKGSGLQT